MISGTRLSRTHWRWLQRMFVVTVALTVLINVVRWGGTGRPGPLFVLGVAISSALIVGFGALIAWLFARPRPVIARTAWQVAQRQVLATLTLVSSACFVSGFWIDEVWHRQARGFGDDFWWTPHLLIYGSLALFLIFAGGGLLVSLRRPGSLAEWLRADASLTLLALVATFLVVSAPADELWHPASMARI